MRDHAVWPYNLYRTMMKVQRLALKVDDHYGLPEHAKVRYMGGHSPASPLRHLHRRKSRKDHQNRRIFGDVVDPTFYTCGNQRQWNLKPYLLWEYPTLSLAAFSRQRTRLMAASHTVSIFVGCNCAAHQNFCCKMLGWRKRGRKG